MDLLGWVVGKTVVSSCVAPLPALKNLGVYAKPLVVWASWTLAKCAHPNALMPRQQCTSDLDHLLCLRNLTIAMAEFQLNFLEIFPILAFVCWVGLLLLSLCYLKGNSSFSIFWKQGDISQVSKPEFLKDTKSFFSNGCIQCYQFPSRYCFFCISSFDKLYFNFHLLKFFFFLLRFLPWPIVSSMLFTLQTFWHF